MHGRIQAVTSVYCDCIGGCCLLGIPDRDYGGIPKPRAVLRSDLMQPSHAAQSSSFICPLLRAVARFSCCQMTSKVTRILVKEVLHFCETRKQLRVRTRFAMEKRAIATVNVVRRSYTGETLCGGREVKRKRGYMEGLSVVVDPSALRELWQLDRADVI